MALQMSKLILPREVFLQKSSNYSCYRTPQSAHHPRKNHVEHGHRNPGGDVHFVALLLASHNSYTTLSKIPQFLDRKPCVGVVYGWWSPIVRENREDCDLRSWRTQLPSQHAKLPAYSVTLNF